MTLVREPASVEHERWTFDASWQVLSYHFRIRSDIPGVGAVLPRLMKHFPTSGVRPKAPEYRLRLDPDGDRAYRAELDGSVIQTTDSPGTMFDWFIVHVTQMALERLDGSIAVHAGAVSLSRIGLLLPAAPDAGKTTLVAGLVRAGFSYLSEEVAIIDARSGCVQPFPRSLNMEASSIAVLGDLLDRLPPEYRAFRKNRYHVAPDDLRPAAVGQACPVAFVVSPGYEPGTASELVPLSMAETLYLLGNHAFNLKRMGRAGLDTLAKVAGEAAGFRLRIGDLPSAVGIIRRLFETEAIGWSR